MLISAQGIQDGVLQVLGIIEHRLGKLCEAGNHQPGVNGDVTAVGGEVSQTVQCRVRLERSTIIGERHKRRRIQTDLQVLSESSADSRVQTHSRAFQGDLNIGTPATQVNRAHQEGTPVFHTLVRPLHESDTEL